MTTIEELEKYWKCNQMVAETGQTIQEVWDSLTEQEQTGTEKNRKENLTCKQT